MGLLDDAIREHLDLKRRRGADPTEVERAEREALGPVRRAPEAAATDPEAHAPAAAGGFAYDQEGEGWDDAAPEGTPAPPSRASRREPAEPGFDDEPLHGDESEAPPGPKRSRLSRIFGRPEAEPEPELEYEDIEEDEFEEPPAPEPRGRASRSLPEPEPGLHEAPRTPAPHPAGGPAGDHTVEYNIDEALGSDEGEGEGEDVLEETPEFLQDTPDHDRLWFEQRPPRDFDLDG